MGTDIEVFGNSIALSADGKTIVIGLPGVVQVYAFNYTISNWIQVGSDIEDETDGEYIGTSVAISDDGKTIAVTSTVYKDNLFFVESGNVYVFAFNSNASAWFRVGNVIIGEKSQEIMSIDMSASGKTIAIGVKTNFEPIPLTAGFVRVYRMSSVTNQWKPIGSDIIGEAAGDVSGFSIAMSANGKTIAIGGYRNDGNGDDSGHVRVYAFDDVICGWKQIGNDIDGEAPGDNSGYSVAMTNDGKTIAVSAIHNDNRYGKNSGHVRVYSFVASTKIWTQIGADINGNKTSDTLGGALAMSADGSTIIIGAPFGGDKDVGAGYAQVYKYKPTTACTISWNLYNMQNGTIVAPLVNNTRIRNPPPCGYANIEAYLPCANTTSHVVTIELYDQYGKLYKRRTDTTSPYFLYGKYGKIKAGNYTIRAIVNQTASPFLSSVTPYKKFTLRGSCA